MRFCFVLVEAMGMDSWVCLVGCNCKYQVYRIGTLEVPTLACCYYLSVLQNRDDLCFWV